ncbi:MAG: pyridoxal phosphate-dependent aminotransferase [Defluviitaleaceae bacterium]|nr:pyridoxal phosphate-dependent aminotransferase [Defluviitaleaceae bacterium]
MLTVNKSSRLDNVRYDIRGRLSVEAEEMQAQGVEIIKLNTGNPAAFGFPPPPFIPRLLEENLPLAGAYSASKGLGAAREAVAAYCKSKRIPGVAPDDVYLGNGVSELILISLQALLEPGDEVLIPAPDYPLWTAAVNMCGGRAVHYLCDEQNGWQPDPGDMRGKLTKRTKAVVVINPNNPTGAVYPEATLKEIVKIAESRGLLIFSDEIYDRLLMDGETHVSTAECAGDYPTVTFNGLSKSHNMSGFRCGWMCLGGNKSGMKGYRDGLLTLASMRLCSNVPSQAIIGPALDDIHYADDTLVPGGRLYEQRECAYEAVNSIPGLSVVKPRAAMYMFPRMDLKTLRIHDDEKFALDFLREKHVLLTHGRSFNWGAPDHFRLVYLPEKKVLEDVLERLRDFLSSYCQAEE